MIPQMGDRMMLNTVQILELLKKDVVPALGCTEPVCVALCAANAGKLCEGKIESVEVFVNAGIYKNGMSAGIPNCTKVGLVYAAAIGAVLKNPEKGLELLSDLAKESLAEAEELAERNAVSVVLNEQEKGLYVECKITTEKGTSVCVIRNAHTNIVLVKKNDEILFQKNETGKNSEDPLVTTLMDMKIEEILDQVCAIPADELGFMLDGVKMNEDLAAYSEMKESGVGIAAAYRRQMAGGLMADDLMNRIILKAASAAESRLDGCPLPTMSSSGAGTKGLVVILPVSETAKAVGAEKEQTVRALAFSHLVNRYINAYIGKLSPMCTCVAAASTAAAAGMAYLLGGTKEQIGHTIRNMTGMVTGMICDGGKVGCAMKVAAGSVSALLCAMTAVDGAVLRVTDGICAETPEDGIKNMARIGTRGMAQTDREILNVMLEK